MTGAAVAAVALPAGVLADRSAGSRSGHDDASGATASPVNAPPPINTALNAQSGWYVPQDWGQQWRAKLRAAKANKGSAAVAIAGDSVGFGFWASDMFTTSWAGRLGAELAAIGGDGGSGFVGQAHSASVLFNPGSRASQSYRSAPGNVWDESGVWQAVAPPYMFGPGIGAVMATAPGVRLSGRFRGSQLVLWYYDGGAPFTISIDGKTVRSVQVGMSWAPTQAVVDVPGGDPGEHEWAVVGGFDSAAKFGSAICGVEGRRPTGVRVNNHAFPGLYASFLANRDTPYQTGTYVGGWRNPADLVIYELGGNDIGGQDPKYKGGTPADVWATNVKGYLEGLQQKTYTGPPAGRNDVLILLPPFNPLGETHSLLPEYRRQMRALAQTYHAAMFDGTSLITDGWDAWVKDGLAGNSAKPGAAGDDGAHPSDAGHALIASHISPLITALN